MADDTKPIPGFNVLVLGAPGCAKALRSVRLFPSILSCDSTAGFRRLVSTDPGTGKLSPQGAMIQSGSYLGVVLSDTLEEDDPELTVSTILQRLSTAKKLGNARVGMCILGVSTLGHDLKYLSSSAYLINEPAKMTTGTIVETLCSMFGLPAPVPDMTWWARPIDVEDPDWEPGPPEPARSTTAAGILGPALGDTSPTELPQPPQPAAVDSDDWDDWDDGWDDAPQPSEPPPPPPRSEPSSRPPPAAETTPAAADDDLDLDDLIGIEVPAGPTKTTPASEPPPPRDPAPAPVPVAVRPEPEELDISDVEIPAAASDDASEHDPDYTETEVGSLMGVTSGGDLPEVAPAPGRTALGRVISVTVPKGGAGKSSMALELSSLLALRLRHINRTVALVDANKSQGDVGMVLGLTGPTILDLYAETGMRDMTAEQVLQFMPAVPGLPENFRVLLAPPSMSQSNIPMVLYKRAIHQMRTLFDYVFVDCPVAEAFRADDLNDAIMGVLRRDGHDAVMVPLIPDISMVTYSVNWLDTISSESYRQAGNVGIDRGMVRWLLNQEDSHTGMTLAEVRSHMHKYDRGFLGSVPADPRWKQARNAHRMLSRTADAADIQAYLAKVLFHLTRERALDYTSGQPLVQPAPAKKRRGLFGRR